MARVVVDRSGIEFREIGPWFEMAASQSGQRVHLRSWLRCGGTPPASSGREAASGSGRGSQSLQKSFFTTCVARLAMLIGAPSQRETRKALRRTTQLYIDRSEEHTSELQSLMRIYYAVFCLKKKKNNIYTCIKIHNIITQPVHRTRERPCYTQNHSITVILPVLTLPTINNAIL